MKTPTKAELRAEIAELKEVRNLALDHIDESGYWFNFELEPSGIKQTYCVRHTDL